MTAETRVVLRAGYRLELVRATDTASEPAVALDATAIVALDGAAPSVALFNPGSALDAGAGERLLAAFRPETLAEAAIRLGYGDEGLVLFRRESAPVSAALDLTVRRVVHELRTSGDAAVLDLAAALLAVDLVREHGHLQRETRLERSRAGLVDRRLRRSVEFMHDNFARDLPLGEIAEAAYLSEYHFARLFKRLTGVTPHAYLATLRMEHARKLLVESDLSVAEIAARVGYGSASHFGKVFRQLCGATPSAYRDAVLR